MKIVGHYKHMMIINHAKCGSNGGSVSLLVHHCVQTEISDQLLDGLLCIHTVHSGSPEDELLALVIL